MIMMQNEPANEENSSVNASLLLKAGTPDKLDSGLAEFKKLRSTGARIWTIPIWHYNLGLTYLAKKNPEAARAQLEEAIRLKRDYVPLASRPGPDMSLERNLYQGTLRYANEALALRPNLPKAMLYRSAGLMWEWAITARRAPSWNSWNRFRPATGRHNCNFALLELAEKR